jgi:hypothetical protein|eukprot:COSAG01_NODE_11044_length_2020_cov_114.786160_2_plen_122_part_00
MSRALATEQPPAQAAVVSPTQQPERPCALTAAHVLGIQRPLTLVSAPWRGRRRELPVLQQRLDRSLGRRSTAPRQAGQDMLFFYPLFLLGGGRAAAAAAAYCVGSAVEMGLRGQRWMPLTR